MLTFIVSISFAQYTPMTAAGYQFKRILCDSTLHIPSFCGIPTLRNSSAKNGAIAMDTCNFKIYMWTNAAGWGEIIGAGTDTTSLSLRIDQRVKYTDTAQMLLAYLRKQDTSNKWVNAVTKINDTAIRVWKGTTSSVISLAKNVVYTQSPIMSKVSGDSNIIYFNADTANVWRGGGGAVPTLNEVLTQGNISQGINIDVYNQFISGNAVSLVANDAIHPVPYLSWFNVDGGYSNLYCDNINPSEFYMPIKSYSVDTLATLADVRASGGGGGGISGSGTTNYIPKFSASTSLSNSSIFDDGTSVGIGTTSPTSTYKLNVNGITRSTGFNTADGTQTGLYGVTNGFDIYTGNNKVATYHLNGTGSGSYFEHILGFTNNGTSTGTQNIWKLTGNVSAITATNTMNSNQLLINPTYNQSTFGTGTLRGIYYNPTITSLNTSKHIAFESTSGNVVLKGLKTSSSTTDSIAIFINDTLTKAAYPSISGGIPHGTATGTDTYAVTISGVASYTDGDSYLVRFTNGNTTGCTLNINGLGAKTLYRNNDGALIGGDIVDGGEALCVYNSTLNGFQCIGTAPNTLISYITNVDASTITKGQVVYAFGGTGDRMTVKLASNSSEATSAQTFGVVISPSIATNQKGLVMVQGLLDGLSILPTSTYADGDALYLGSTAGSITNVKPSAPSHLVYLGNVTTSSNGSAGRWYVRVQNGYELGELQNVALTSPPTDNDGLFYETSTSLWKNKSIATVLGYTPIAPADTSVFQRKSISSYSIMANNTNADANTTAQVFKDISGTYTGTITWNGTAPTTATISTYQWQQIGKWVKLQIYVYYTNSGTACSNVSLSIPADMPTPDISMFTSGALSILYTGTGGLGLSNTSLTTTTNAYMRRNAANNGNEFFITAASANYRRIQFELTYRAQ